jgi:hypothetical protein
LEEGEAIKLNRLGNSFPRVTKSQRQTTAGKEHVAAHVSPLPACGERIKVRGLSEIAMIAGLT